MAGDWIKMRTDLWDHPKVVRIVSAICPDGVRNFSERCKIVGALYRTWALADTHADDGILDGYDAAALDFLVGIEGWSLNLQHVGWLTVEPQRLVLNNFTEHNGLTAKRRAEDAARKGRVRKMSGKCPQKNGQKSAKTKNREEKRREEINPLPLSLDTPSIVSLFAEYVAHRRESKKPLTATAAKRAIAKLEAMGPERAVAALEHSIASGYQGIFEPGESRAPASPAASIDAFNAARTPEALAKVRF